MTGPEHYERAEALLVAAQSEHLLDSDELGRVVEFYEESSPGMHAALVHALLALTAAHVNAYHSTNPADMRSSDWAQVLS